MSVQAPARPRRRGDVYLSPGYDGAQNRIDLRVESGVGSIEISSD